MRRLWLILPLLLAALACGGSTALPTRLATTVPDADETAETTPGDGTARPTRPDNGRPTTTAGQPTITSVPGDLAVSLSAPPRMTLGAEVRVGGTTNAGPEMAPVVQLLALDGRLLVETTGLVKDSAWEATLAVPEAVSGPAQLQVALRDPAGRRLAFDFRPVTLILDAENADRYLALNRPAPGTTAVAGHYLYFDGQTLRPNGSVTIGLLGNECGEMVARQTFRLRSGGYWQGYLVVPPDFAGPACAVAYTSLRGDEAWREVQLPVTVLPQDDPGAEGIVVTQPLPDGRFAAGSLVPFTGIVFNAPDDALLLSVALADGRLVTQESIPIQSYGYWESAVRLPIDVSGQAQVIVAAGDPVDDRHATVDFLIDILPAP